MQGGKQASLLSPERAEGKLQGVVVMGGMGVSLNMLPG